MTNHPSLSRAQPSRPLRFDVLEDRSVPAIVNLSWTDPSDPPPVTETFAVIETNAGPDGYGAISVTNPKTGLSTNLSDNRTLGYRAWVRPVGAAVETVNGVKYLLVVDPYGGRDGYGAIKRVNLANGSVQLVSDNQVLGYRGLVRPQAIVIEPSPNGRYLLIVDPSGGRDGRGAVRRLNLQTGGLQLVTDNLKTGYRALSTPVGAALETVGSQQYLILIDPSGGRDGYGAIKRVNLATGSVQLVSDNQILGYRGLNRPNAGIFETSGGDRYLRVVDPDGGAYGQATVRVINLANGGAGLMAIGGELENPNGIAAASDGLHYLTDLDRFEALDAIVEEESRQIKSIALSNYDKGYFANKFGDLWYKNGVDVTRVGLAYSSVVITRDRQEAYGLRFDGLLSKWQGGSPVVWQTRVLSIHLNADGQSVFVNRQIRSSYPEFSSDGYSLVAIDHLNAIRLNPSLFDDFYNMYSGQVGRELGFRFLELNDEGKMAAFAAVVAYQMKPYGFSDALVNTDLDASLARVLAEPRIACDRYCYLTMLLYERGRTEAGLQPLNWNMVGFDLLSATGNHAQLFVNGGGLPLLLDPTIGLVVRTDLNHVMSGTAIDYSYIREPAYRVEADPDLASNIYNGIGRIRTALWAGTYDVPTAAVPPGWSPIVYQHGEDILGL